MPDVLSALHLVYIITLEVNESVYGKETQGQSRILCLFLPRLSVTVTSSLISDQTLLYFPLPLT